MYKVKISSKFIKSLDKLIKNGLKQKYIDDIYFIIDHIASGKKLPSSYRDYKLQGEFSFYRECHIQGDLLLIYQIIDNELILSLINIGSHSDLF
jgi:mRNA interferase YafQ